VSEPRWDTDLQQAATATAVAEARRVARNFKALSIDKLSDESLGVILSAAIFGWIGVRHQQARAAGEDPESFLTSGSTTAVGPDLAEAVKKILPRLAEETGLDWAKPLTDSEPAEMVNFLALAFRLVVEGGGRILRKREQAHATDDLTIPEILRCDIIPLKSDDAEVDQSGVPFRVGPRQHGFRCTDIRREQPSQPKVSSHDEAR
jgi:hypothetical protein